MIDLKVKIAYIEMKPLPMQLVPRTPCLLAVAAGEVRASLLFVAAL